jgi:hypothetical protein
MIKESNQRKCGCAPYSLVFLDFYMPILDGLQGKKYYLSFL